jgi:cobalt/nickel transport system permease protein
LHIPDGMLPASVCAAGYGGTALVTWVSLKRISKAGDPAEGIPRASVMAAAFFVASWIHVPVPPASVHFLLGGLMGVLLGWYAFPAVVTGLFFQAVMFGHGGITTLGVNSIVMGVPALLAGWLFTLAGGRGKTVTGVLAFTAGAGSVALSAAAMAVLVMATVPGDLPAGPEYQGIRTMTLAYVPVALIEGVFTAMVVSFLGRVKPSMLRGGSR